MFDDQDRFDTTELETNAVEMLQRVLLKLDKEIISVKNYVGEKSEKISKERKRSKCKSGESEFAVNDLIGSFYEQVITDLTEIQEVCAEYRIAGLLDLAKETELSLKPASYKAYKKCMRRLDDGYCNPVEQCKKKLLKEEQEKEHKTYEVCACHWTNIPESELEPTQDILKRPIIPRRTAFDMTDLKFKQELAILRTKLFTLPEIMPRSRRASGFNRGSSLLAEINAVSSKMNFKEMIEESASHGVANVEEEFRKIGNLKFVDGRFSHCELWKKLLDACGNQLRSKWLLVLCPQIETMLKKHIVSSAHFSPEKVFRLLFHIPENGATYIIPKEDVLNILGDDSKTAEIFKGWKTQFKAELIGVQFAATTIQRYWKGYAVRKDIRDSDCKYIAASIIWLGWMLVKKKRFMHAQYLSKMLVAINSVEELNNKLSFRYYEMISSPHVVIHLPSLGHPIDIRSAISPSIFKIYQNILALKMSFLKNPYAEIIYILPVAPTEGLLKMYYDILESVHPDKGIQKRVTYLDLSLRNAFVKCSYNTARALYYSNDTIVAIKEKIVDKSVYILPWVMDECDVWVAGSLQVPWVGPSFDLQSRLLNKSHNAELLTDFGMPQPFYATNIKDYASLCTKLAELICLHSEICLWLIKLNIGIDGNQTGVFLINNISVPFMPELRRAREMSGGAWKRNSELRQTYLEQLIDHLPKVVFNNTRLAANYKNWRDFYCSLMKHGCLLQAVPNERNPSIISAGIFIPATDSGMKPVWTGTADQMHLGTQFTAFGFMMPQTSFPNEYLRITVNKLAEFLQKLGYFGYVSFDLFCYIRRSDDSYIVFTLDVDPYYSKVHNFLDWFCFTINGTYDPEKNSYESDVDVAPEARKKYYHPASKIIKWNETAERFGVVMGRLHHTHLYRYRWPKLYYLGKKCKITYDAKTRIGSHVAFHDGESRAHVMMSTCNVTMKQCLQMVTSNLKNLSRALTIKYKGVVETNISAAATYLATLTSTYHPIHKEACATMK